MPALRRANTEWEIPGEVIVAVTRLADTVRAADDDVRAEGITCAECSVGLVCWADELSSCVVIGDLCTGKSSRGGEENSRVDHLVCIQARY